MREAVRAATILKRLGIAAVGLVALLGFTVLTSAAVDRPSKTIQSVITIDAPKETVWRVLTDFDSYERWNPLITAAEGDARLGTHIKIDIHPPDSETQELSPEITILRPNRKLAWMSRGFIPGISDREYEVIIDELGAERVRVVMHKRFEGILISFTSTSAEQAGLDLMAEALKRRAEAAARVGGA